MNEMVFKGSMVRCKVWGEWTTREVRAAYETFIVVDGGHHMHDGEWQLDSTFVITNQAAAKRGVKF